MNLRRDLRTLTHSIFSSILYMYVCVCVEQINKTDKLTESDKFVGFANRTGMQFAIYDRTHFGTHTF